jgi:hypothetical protein
MSAASVHREEHAAPSASPASAGLAMSLATFAMAGASGIQAVLYLDAFGIGGRTDGFFIAFGLYATFGVFSQSIRVTTVPLLVGHRARLGPRELAIVMLAIGLPVAVATIPLAKPLADVLAPGLAPAHRAITESALPLLGGAMVLQLWAAGAATLLAVRSRFAAIARAYTIGSIAGLVAFLIARGPAGELSLGWSMLTMAVVTFALATASAVRSQPVGPERSPGPLRIGDAFRKTPLVLGHTVIYLAFNGLYVITAAYVSRRQPGEATVLSYAYLFASYMVTGTAFALGMGRIAEMRRATIAERAQSLADTVLPGFRYSLMVVAPGLAALVLCIPTIAGGLLPASLDASEVARLRLFGALLVPWTIAALMVNLLLPAMLAHGRERFVNGLAVPLVIVQVIATAAGSAMFGAPGAVGAFFVAPTCLAIVLAQAGSGKAGASRLRVALARDTFRFGGLALVAFGLGSVVGIPIADGTVSAVVAGVVGGAIYLALLVRAAPEEAGVVVASLKRGRRQAPSGPAPAQVAATPAGAAALDG